MVRVPHPVPQKSGTYQKSSMSGVTRCHVLRHNNKERELVATAVTSDGRAARDIGRRRVAACVHREHAVTAAQVKTRSMECTALLYLA